MISEPRRHRTKVNPAQALVVAIITMSLVGCAATKPGSRPQPSVARTITGSFTVGDHQLHIACQGTGSPTVVYLHGAIDNPQGGSGANGAPIADVVRAHHRICLYDRANVGLSGSKQGPLTGKDAVTDLHRLLTKAGVSGPYVLLGASFGGALADMYAATYRSDVVGMVLLDPSLADDVVNVDEKYLPDADRLHHADWQSNTEQFDRLATYDQTRALQIQVPQVPVSMFVIKNLDLDAAWPVEAMTAAIRTDQRRFINHFAKGRLITKDVPHYMEPVIPGEIAAEVERVAASATKP